MSGEQQSQRTGTSTNFGEKCCDRLPISGFAAVSGSHCLQVQGGVSLRRSTLPKLLGIGGARKPAFRSTQ